jgi:signal transduction histidine kinase
VPSGIAYDDTLELALRLHPETERIWVVAQAPDPTVEGLMRAEVDKFSRKTTISHITERSLPRLLDTIRALPARSLVFYIRYSREDPGHVLFPAEVAGIVAQAAPVPVYVNTDSHIGSGVVGGMVYDTEALATRVGEMTRQILAGTPARDIPLEQPIRVPTFDWRQVQSWGIDPSSLPVGADIRFRAPTMWESYRGYILGATAVVALQTLLIGGLLAQRSKRRRAEAAIRTNEAVLQKSYEQIRRLAGRLIRAQEVERARIARDLHDDLSQKVALLAIDIDEVSRTTAGALTRFSRMADRAAEIATDVHNLSHALHPAKLQILGLVPATQAFCRDFAARHDMEIEFSHDHMPAHIPPDSALCLFRIVQEGLQNVVKHSGTRIAGVTLTSMPGSLQLEVSDSGAGFDAAELRGGIGLLSMRERVNFLNGRMAIWSMPRSGTRITVRVPLEPANAELNRTDDQIA